MRPTLIPVLSFVRRLRQDGACAQQANEPDGPPELDEIWRDFTRQIDRLFGRRPPDHDGRPDRWRWLPLSVLTLLAAGAGWLASGLYQVSGGQTALVLQFGRVVGTAGPGTHWHRPWPLQTVDTVSLTAVHAVPLLQPSPGPQRAPGTMLTADRRIITVQGTLEYRVAAAADYRLKLVNPDAAIAAVADAATRSAVARTPLQQLLEQGVDALPALLSTAIQQQLDAQHAGVTVIGIKLTLQAPGDAGKAVDEAVAARDAYRRALESARADAQPQLAPARALVKRLDAEARAYQQQVVATARTNAERFGQIVADYERDPVATRNRIYVETMQQIFSGGQKVVVNGQPAAPLLSLSLPQLRDAVAHPDAVQASVSTSAPATETRTLSRDRELR